MIGIGLKLLGGGREGHKYFEQNFERITIFLPIKLMEGHHNYHKAG